MKLIYLSFFLPLSVMASVPPLLVPQIFVTNVNAFACNLVYTLEINVQTHKKNSVLLHHLIFINLYYILNSFLNRQGKITHQQVQDLLKSRLQKQYDKNLNLNLIKFSSSSAEQL